MSPLRPQAIALGSQYPYWQNQLGNDSQLLTQLTLYPEQFLVGFLQSFEQCGPEGDQCPEGSDGSNNGGSDGRGPNDGNLKSSETIRNSYKMIV
jgi:hypothetical protein